MPNTVMTDNNDNLAVNYNHLVGVLLAAVKQQRDKLRELEQKLNQQQA